MTDVIITGFDNGETEKLLRENLSENYCVNYIKSNSFSRFGKGYELICIESENMSIDNIGTAVILIRGGSSLPDIRTIPEGSVAIVDADSPEQLRVAEALGIYTVTCGTAASSTVSYTGESDEYLTVSLNRSISALSGRMIEPLEIPVKKLGCNRYTIMSVTALRLILDDCNSELNGLI